MTRYDGPVIDAHHHFWEPSLGHQPWLRPGVDIGFRYGPYEAIKRDYLPADIRRDAMDAGIHLVGTVTMETEWELDDPVGEMQYTARIAEREGLPDGAVAHAELDDPAVEGVLEQLADIPLVRGVRHKPGQSVSPETSSNYPTLLADPQWRRGLSLLRKYGLSFDLQVAWWQFPQAIAALEDLPDLPVILNHAGLPSDRSPEALDAWADAIAAIGRLPQVVVKASGIGLRDVPWTVANNGPIIRHLIETFGPNRLMFASNFPVDSLTASYAEIWNGFREITQEYTDDEQLQMFAGTAQRVYRLPSRLLDPQPTLATDPRKGH
jgi:predicted TIM-barrel fold metal-dependent hydrolase